jgi:hypothetical protein
MSSFSETGRYLAEYVELFANQEEMVFFFVLVIVEDNPSQN